MAQRFDSDALTMSGLAIPLTRVGEIDVPGYGPDTLFSVSDNTISPPGELQRTVDVGEPQG